METQTLRGAKSGKLAGNELIQKAFRQRKRKSNWEVAQNGSKHAITYDQYHLVDQVAKSLAQQAARRGGDHHSLTQ